MPLSPEQKQQLTNLASRIIKAMNLVDASAQRALRDAEASAYSSASTFAYLPNTMLGAAPEAYSLMRVRDDIRQGLRRLKVEPFVADVLAQDELGQVRRVYFSRTTAHSVDGLDGQLCNIDACLGRLAEQSPGESIEIVPHGRPPITYQILERTQLRPNKSEIGWDAIDVRAEINMLKASIKSLRDFLTQVSAEPTESADFLGALFAEDESARAVQEGIRRGVINRVSLRDQPVLDRYQGEVFRLPVSRRVMLSGPPGTGKTTTLIRRLAQKRNQASVLDSEGPLLPPDRMGEFFHPDNWVMFTPTELLKLFLKEAFAREGIAASDERVRTWSDERRRLSRDVFRVLRSERGGRFTLVDETTGLRECGSESLMALAEAFKRYFEQQTTEQYETALHGLLDSDDPVLAALVETMRGRTRSQTPRLDPLFDFVEFHESLRSQINQLSIDVDTVVHGVINRLLNRDRNFLAELGMFLENLSVEEEEEEEEDIEGVDEHIPSRDSRLIAAEAIRRALNAKAIALDEGRRISNTSRNAEVLARLGSFVPEDDELRSLGRKLTRLRRLRFLTNTYRNLIDRIPVIYQRFRRAAIRDGQWYSPDSRDSANRYRVAGAEVDVMLLLMLRNARRFLLRQGGRGLREDTRVSSLEAVKSEYVTQVLVDEAPDFSPVQLACMLEMAHPTFQSYFACGDVRQRATRWGLRDLAQLSWISPDFEVRRIEICYRQSRRMAALAGAATSLRGAEPPVCHVPDFVEDDDVWPLLREHLAGQPLAQWLADRIREIERILGSVPSIAIVVDGDEKIDPLISNLRPILLRQNLDVLGCKEGRMMGLESQIRVFDVQYIKGLEFEAVFFVGVDRLVASHSDLFENYLLIGVTRAATYLGLTCEGSLPSALESLRSHLSEGIWA